MASVGRLAIKATMENVRRNWRSVESSTKEFSRMKRLLVQIVCQDWSSIGIGFISAVTHKTKRIGDMKLSNLLYHKVRDESH